MAIKIDKIKVMRAGPLNKDFELEPGDLNLIYGHNESGKTYIVETMINLLFRTGSKSPAGWNLREWNLNGKIMVSGLQEQDNRVFFTKKNKKLEDYWKEGASLPIDLSRLLVVKAGETMLVEKEKDGVGRNILKHYLSGEGLLDKIEANISKTLQGATANDRQIVGTQAGEIKTRTDLKKRLDKLNTLIKDVEEGYASGEVSSLQQKVKKIEAELNKLEKAKRYHAAKLHEQMQALYQNEDKQPAEKKLSELKDRVTIFKKEKGDAAAKSKELENLEGSSKNYNWAKKALDDYSEIMSQPAVAGPKPILMIFALLFLIGVVISGFFGLNIPLIVCGTGALASFVLYHMEAKNALARSGESMELEKLKADFKNRFKTELTNKAALKEKLEKLNEDHILAKSLREEINKLTHEINLLKIEITNTLKELIGTEVPHEQWDSSIENLKKSVKELADLGVPKKDYLDEDPGAEWNAGRYETLEGHLKKNNEALGGEIRKLDNLKTRIIQETSPKSAEWEDLITELRDKHEQAVEEYRDITAEILAKVQVKSTIKEFRKEENARISDGLERHEITSPLKVLTAGRYDRIRQEESSGLVLVTDKDEEYPLADISTGAREQVFLAMRIGFASIAMKGQPAFIILDDAFQHSDWVRREKLIAEVLRLVQTGWQVFYFAMDDNIRNSFQEAGGKLMDRFKSLELC